jgi:hypothetical protein
MVDGGNGSRQFPSSGQPGGRRDRRYRVVLPVTLVAGGESLQLCTANISLRGLQLRTDRTFNRNQLLRLELRLPFDGGAISLFGAVAYTVAGDVGSGREPGSGVALYANGPDVLRRWETFVRTVSDKHPESLERDVLLGDPGESTQHVRRRYQRFEVEITFKAFFDEVDDLVAMYTRDVSKGGMLIATDLTLAVGARIHVNLVHPATHAEFPLACVVRRVVNDSSGRGLGVEFADLDEDARQHLWEFVSSGLEELLEVSADSNLDEHAPD